MEYILAQLGRVKRGRIGERKYFNSFFLLRSSLISYAWKKRERGREKWKWNIERRRRTLRLILCIYNVFHVIEVENISMIHHIIYIFFVTFSPSLFDIARKRITEYSKIYTHSQFTSQISNQKQKKEKKKWNEYSNDRSLEKILAPASKYLQLR